MIQMFTKVDVADNTGAKQAMVFNVYKGSTARPGKYRLKTAKIGDIVMVTVKKALPNSEFSGGADRKDRSKRRKAKAVVVRMKRPMPRADGSCVRLTAMPWCCWTTRMSLAGRAFSERWPASCAKKTL